jgi:hypothetical protein
VGCRLSVDFDTDALAAEDCSLVPELVAYTFVITEARLGPVTVGRDMDSPVTGGSQSMLRNVVLLLADMHYAHLV